MRFAFGIVMRAEAEFGLLAAALTVPAKLASLRYAEEGAGNVL